MTRQLERNCAKPTNFIAMDWEDINSEDSEFCDEDLGMRKRALHVEMPNNFDPNKIPENGEEYLQHVMYEAKKCPAFKVAEVDIQKIKPSLKVQVKESCRKAPKSMLPSMSWQDEAVDDFAKFRKFIFKQLETYPKNTKETLTPHLSELPKLSILASFTQEDKIKVLESILSQIDQIKKGEFLRKEKSVWLYSLLATLDLPLCPDTCHVLREIARKCSQIRSCLTESVAEEHYVPLNLYICLIARFFRQLDLADE